MKKKKTAKKKVGRPDKRDPLKFHIAGCSICQGENREEIEHRYLDWTPTKTIATDYHLELWTLYRHNRFFGLKDKRNADRTKFLNRIIAKSMTAEATVSDGIAAVKQLDALDGKGFNDRPLVVVGVKDVEKKDAPELIDLLMGRAEKTG